MLDEKAWLAVSALIHPKGVEVKLRAHIKLTPSHPDALNLLI